jgi:nucleoid-associated protein YgaU
MKLTPWTVLVCLGLVGCSGSKSAQQVNEETPQIELSDADEFVENSAAADSAPEVAVDPVSEDPTEATESTVSDSPLVEDEAVIISNENPASRVDNFEPGATKQYTVGKNETLMLVAFKLYGNYEKWKKLANENHAVLKGGTSVKEGMLLTYTAPAEEFVWNPAGSPYLIRTGDTLGTISKSVYQTMSKWKMLWENNRPLIKDPNKIYAGFTIYYVDSRDVATDL